MRSLAAALGLACGTAFAQAPVDPELPDFSRTQGISGTVRSIGSSTLTNMLYRLSAEYRRAVPGVTFEIASGGSDTAVPALIEGRADLGPMSRPMNLPEIDRFKAKFGYEPTRITLAVDAIAIYVNKNNPLTQASLAQLERVFAIAPRGGAKPFTTWGELGLAGDWGRKSILIYGPSHTQGLHSVFRGAVMGGGEYRFEMRSEPVPSSIVQAAGTYDGAIGFASQFLHTERTHALALARDPAGPYVPPTAENAISGRYPLARKLYIYVNRAPGKPLAPQVADFLRFACSEQGQDVVARDGNFPLDATLSAKECNGPIQ